MATETYGNLFIKKKITLRGNRIQFWKGKTFIFKKRKSEKRREAKEENHIIIFARFFEYYAEHLLTLLEYIFTV